MTDEHVLVIGAGPAGLAATNELARLGLSVRLVEQRDQVGGAIYRAPADKGYRQVMLPRHHRQRREGLLHGLAHAGSRIHSSMQSVFIGADRDGRFLIDNRLAGRVESIRPKAVIAAVGTVESVLPREGWELPGVVTAGGMQVLLKETGQPPGGPILLAGNGPLLLALAAQLTAAGNPPVAILERGRPLLNGLLQPFAVFDATRHWPNVQDFMAYAKVLMRERVPYRSGWGVVSIRRNTNGLLVGCQRHDGTYREFLVQHLALHDGLTPNTLGLPKTDHYPNTAVIHAGDCREVLGALAAVDDGQRAARQIARMLDQCQQETIDRQLNMAIARAQRTQRSLASLLLAPPIEPTADTMICRCEGLRRADFDRLQVAGSARELRLVGRFGMGNCQGRFCAGAISQLAKAQGINFDAADLNGEVARWPLRPVALSALANYQETDF